MMSPSQASLRSLARFCVSSARHCAGRSREIRVRLMAACPRLPPRDASLTWSRRLLCLVNPFSMTLWLAIFVGTAACPRLPPRDASLTWSRRLLCPVNPFSMTLWLAIFVGTAARRRVPAYQVNLSPRLSGTGWRRDIRSCGFQYRLTALLPARNSPADDPQELHTRAVIQFSPCASSPITSTAGAPWTASRTSRPSATRFWRAGPTSSGSTRCTTRGWWRGPPGRPCRRWRRGWGCTSCLAPACVGPQNTTCPRTPTATPS